MISTFDIIDILYIKLKTSALKAAVSGGLYKQGERPDNSTKEDIVINCLPTSGSQLQTATVNVNIYVPDSELTISGKPQFKAKFSRLQALAELAITLLKEVSVDDYHYKIAFQGTLKEESIHQHFINIRIEFKKIN